MSDRHDWYRKKTWTLSNRDDFESRLARARKHNRAQYLPIQAGCLLKSKCFPEAIELVDRMLSDYPSKSFAHSAHSIQADCFAELGMHNKAIESYRAALQAERDYPNSRSNVHLDFAEYVLINCHEGLYDEALQTLIERQDFSSQFPLHEYLEHALKACLLESLNKDGSRQHAELARIASAKEHSGFWKHPSLCLVDREPNWLKQRLDQILASK